MFCQHLRVSHHQLRCEAVNHTDNTSTRTVSLKYFINHALHLEKARMTAPSFYSCHHVFSSPASCLRWPATTLDKVTKSARYRLSMSFPELLKGLGVSLTAESPGQGGDLHFNCYIDPDGRQPGRDTEKWHGRDDGKSISFLTILCPTACSSV